MGAGGSDPHPSREEPWWKGNGSFQKLLGGGSDCEPRTESVERGEINCGASLPNVLLEILNCLVPQAEGMPGPARNNPPRRQPGCGDTGETFPGSRKGRTCPSRRGI